MRTRFLKKISWLDCEKYGKNQCKKMKDNQHSSVSELLRKLSYYLIVTDPLIISMIFTFLSCHPNAHDNREFSRKNVKPCRESQSTTR